MTRNLVAEWKTRVAHIDKMYSQDVSEVKTIEIERGYKHLMTEELYNIHKRSLPVGYDKVVGIGFTKLQAIDAIGTFFKAKANNSNSDYHWYYYDMVVQNASPDEKSIYWNEKQITKDEETL